MSDEELYVSEEESEFIQLVGSRRLYHLDVEHLDGTELPLATKPTWELNHFYPDGSPAPNLATLETSADSRTGRLITGNLPGVIVVTVNANVSAAAHASTIFKIHVKQHPPTPRHLSFKITPSRDAPLH